MTNRGRPPAGRARAFTLVELLVSMSVLAILMLLVTQVIGQVQKVWSQSNTRNTQFREARTAFDLVTHNLSQAVLNPYWDTDAAGLSSGTYYSRAGQTPTRYSRKSDLHFICGPAATLVTGDPAVSGNTNYPFHAVFFQATLGVTQITDYDKMQNLLCGRGYFVKYSNDDAFKPPFVTTSNTRYRLMEYSPTAEQDSIYADQKAKKPANTWFSSAGAAMIRSSDASSSSGGATPVARGTTRPIAENIIALIIAPRVSDHQVSTGQDPHWIAPLYAYDSTQTGQTSANAPDGTKNLLPPLVDVIMVAIDETTQANFNNSDDITQLQSLFTNASQMTSDLQALQGLLVNRQPPKKPVNFRIFKTTVEIRSARWSL